MNLDIKPVYDNSFYSTLVNGGFIQDTITGDIYFDHEGNLYRTINSLEWIRIDSLINIPKQWIKLEHTRTLEDSFYSCILDSESSKHNLSLAEIYLQKSMNLMEERGKEYNNGKSERSFNKVAIAFNAITGKNITPAEVCLLLQILKDVRQWTSDRLHADSVEDCITYAALKAEELWKQYKVDK